LIGKTISKKAAQLSCHADSINDTKEPALEVKANHSSGDGGG
jgi:hypothetical protein